MSSNRRDKSLLRKQVEELQRKKVAQSDIISITEFRNVEYLVQIPHVLVVEPDESVRHGMKRLLETEGYEVTLAEDGLELAKAMEARAFDLIIIDAQNQWVDGYELCSLVKGNPQVGNVPVLITADKPDQDEIKKAFGAGCDDIALKPFDVSVLKKFFTEDLKKSS